MDILTMIYEKLMGDPYIRENADGRIKYYEFPDAGSVTAPNIVIDPLDVPIPKDFGDNTWMTYDCLFQIEVWSKNRASTRELSNHIRQAMWELGFSQGTGVDEWDKDTGVYRDARRYRGKVYREDLEAL
ncbi:DUF3168 domain-containing protein [Bacillus massiliglaciei]|uniref:DUF3168 domain-containing protein n=1 Tax=Bacillus massiliglaciei TaxID=1816693 RepID=UPI000DA62BF8|nr:DUF3168 domain-containing protein [Bacillus massiliglaciei]